MVALQAGQTFFDTLRLNFTKVTIDGQTQEINLEDIEAAYKENVMDFENVDGNQKIRTDEFVQAVQGVINLFLQLNKGSSKGGFLSSIGSYTDPFKLVQSDMVGNVAKIESGKNYDQQPLQDFLKPRADGMYNKKSPEEGMKWLLGGLQLTSEALSRSFANPSEELSKSFSNAFPYTLRPVHLTMPGGSMTAPLVSVSFSKVPSRETAYKELRSPDVPEERLIQEMKEWLVGLKRVVRILSSFMAHGKN
ncbi:hypothetical protein M501DRAFT_993345 [Patellaria atrata CBS 101060]|uniref:Glycolipid transfer protein domain-containing protein n=1 Tax=Patellaria atrata CBS 101060 TaxID=1346257 RepID=A0A9P4SIW4_9PEZI|nr:hypothetical protein M501DRAFT_993345 [Patellaria atrata CBS 101060]